MTAWKDIGTGPRALLLAGGVVAAAAVGIAVWRGAEAPVSAPSEAIAAKPLAEAEPRLVSPMADADASSGGPVETAAISEPQDQATAPATDAPTIEPAASETRPVAAEPSGDGGTVASKAPATATERSAEQVGAAPETSPGTVAEARTGAEAKTVPTEAVVPPKAPDFDIVRVSPDGAAVIAGTAEAGSSVSLRVDGAEVARADADATGSFVSLFTLAPSADARVVTLLATLEDGRQVPSAASVLIAPQGAPAEVAEAAPAPAAETPAPATGVSSEEPGKAAALSAPAPAMPAATSTNGAPAETAAPAAVLLSDEGATVLQPPAETDATLARNVTIDTISYSGSGDVQLAGRAARGGVVRLYVDNALLMEQKIAEDGTWRGTLPSVAAGIYTLRADQISADGRVLSRYETPFQREAPEQLAGVAGGTQATRITVQPGFTLWGIARESYGEGVMYVRVYEANKTQIRDPDLIYPGQVFTVPVEN